MTDADPKRTPANQNPWYVLMTLYGEQAVPAIDMALHERNREAWNAWASDSLSTEIRDIHCRDGISLPERGKWDDVCSDVRARHKYEMLRRNGDDFSYPGFPELSNMDKVDLSNIEFIRPLCVSGFIFPAAAYFDETIFCNDASFGNVTFTDRVWFRRAKYQGEANFFSTWFPVDTRFSSAIFEKFTSFDTVNFMGLVDFNWVTFYECADFKLCDFKGGCLFGNAMFRSQAHFSSMIFSGDVSFAEAKFQSDVFFHALFECGAQFCAATFSGDSFFAGNFFCGNADFSATTFLKRAAFNNSHFYGKVQFDSILFESSCTFESAMFLNDVRFSSAVFGGFAYFSEVDFGGFGVDSTVTFSDCQFLKPTSFRNAIFHSQYPDLSGAVLHDKTEFTASPENWPPSTLQPPEEAKASCARIRHAIAKQGLPEEEHFFYRREMGFDCRIGPIWQRLPYQLFGQLSDFGYSIQRPVEALLLLWISPAFYFLAHAQAYAGHVSVYPQIGRALALSFANIFNFLGFHRTFFAPDYVQNLPAFLQVLSGFQTVAGVVLLFFLGLGLRTRFRLR